MKTPFSQPFVMALLAFCCLACQEATTRQAGELSSQNTDNTPPQPLKVGAEQFDQYLPLIQDKTVALVVNQTSRIGERHLVDTLLAQGISIAQIFAPEHGFRGKADAGAQVADGKDAQTGLPIVSLYGKNKKPRPQQLEGIEAVIFDIQDVGTRFYTYISTMHYVMEACAEAGIPFIVLDRPNPNGHYVDGPIREEGLKSFVGMHPSPIVHGLTVGELARMIRGEGWLEADEACDLSVIPCSNYTHQTSYSLPVKPSPNLPNDQAIALYPSLCLFEGTQVSVGRGTDLQFQVIGSPFHPEDKSSFQFTPEPKPGAKYPKHQGKACYGKKLQDSLAYQQGFSLEELIFFYRNSQNQADFFNSFFPKLAGTARLQQQIEAGMDEKEIRATWQEGLKAYRTMREEYLLYEE